MDRRSVSISMALGALAPCLVAFPGSGCPGGEADCRAYDAPRDGRLLDCDQCGEVALWSLPAQAFEDGHETTAIIEYGEGGEPVGGLDRRYGSGRVHGQRYSVSSCRCRGIGRRVGERGLCPLGKALEVIPQTLVRRQISRWQSQSVPHCVSLPPRRQRCVGAVIEEQ
jgi:hypothetical protein